MAILLHSVRGTKPTHRPVHVAPLCMIRLSSLILVSCSRRVSDNSADSSERNISPAASTAGIGSAALAKEAAERPAATAGEPADSVSALAPPNALVAEPVGVAETASFGDGVTARLSSVRSLEAKASLPGETSGPAVALDLSISNGSPATIELASITVDLVDSRGMSSILIHSEPPTELSGSLSAGATAKGTYVYRLDPEMRDNASITVKYSSVTPLVTFQGSLPHA